MRGNRIIRACVVAAGSAALAFSLNAPTASAAPYGKTIQMTSSAAVAHCKFSVTSVNLGTETATIKLQADARPAGFGAYFNNTLTVVDCYLYADSTLLHQISPSARTNVAGGDTTVQPLSASYVICGFVAVERRSGEIVASPTVCA